MDLNVISTVILAAHWMIIVGLTIRVIMRRPPVGVSAAWMAVIFSTPLVGAALYLLFGEKRLGRRRARRIKAVGPQVKRWQTRLQETCAKTAADMESTARVLRRHAQSVLGFPAMPGNTLTLLDHSRSIFDALVADIDEARERIHLCFYIWDENGRMGDVIDALIRAARRGVRCRALADAVGSKVFLKGNTVPRLLDAGMEFRTVLATGLVRAFFARADLRNHRKIAVIDGRVAYTGSQNLVDPRFFQQESGVGQWVDAMVRMTGPAAAALDGVFELDWAVETAQPFVPPHAPSDRSAEGVPTESESVVQVVPSGPDLQPEAIHQLLLTAIYAARHELIMTTPYFVPNESILIALHSAALRGVHVTLIVPARNNLRLVRYASVASFDDLMSAGARIALYQGGLLHTKSLTIDGEVSVFGSVNLDMRSIELNFEISLFVYDTDFTDRLRALQFKYLEDSEQLTLHTWRRRPPWRRFAENTCRLLGPIL
jgi:cardiolipin synthase